MTPKKRWAAWLIAALVLALLGTAVGRAVLARRAAQHSSCAVGASNCR